MAAKLSATATIVKQNSSRNQPFLFAGHNKNHAAETNRLPPARTANASEISHRIECRPIMAAPPENTWPVTFIDIFVTS
jgi:hypothetical protein